MPATIHELTCGCIIHPLAGNLRRCAGMPSRTTSGRMVAKPDNAEKKHNDAQDKTSVRTYEVAEILP
jgi:hypothetical protein